ncbi:MAG: MbcA/ParS/Xre antitoxin family protein [Acidobacteriaceae bacterium]|nr:MbcA/ParS/Xre antitoxin family protein [Acidobacteriaceae bacterium]
MATLSLPITPGYAFDNPPDLSSSAERARLSPAALRGYFAIIEKWTLDPDAGAALLGGIPRATFYKLKKTPATLTQDGLTRISYVVGIYKALNILLPARHADAWMARPNHDALFGGRAPLQYVIHGGIPALARVRSMLDAVRGGG